MRSRQFLIISYPYSVNGNVEFRHLQMVVQDIAELYSIVDLLKNQPVPVSVSILTSKGDLLTNDGTQDVRLPVGTDGKVLMADSTTPEGLLWQDPSSLIPAAVWGSITGTLSNQTDLQSALDALVPYTGATADVDLGANNLQLTGTVGIGTVAHASDKLHIYGGASIVRVKLDADNNVAKILSFRTSDVQRWSLRVDGNETGANAGADFSIRRYDDAGTVIDSPVRILRNTGEIRLVSLSGAGTRIVVADANGDLSTQSTSTYLIASNNLSDVSNVATSRTNLGATTVGSNIFTLTNPSAVRWIRINADNTVTARTAAETLSDIGAQASGSYLVTTNNLSDVSNAATAKANLSVIDKQSTADLVTASTSLSTITGLSVTLAANTTYVFEASGSVSNSANNGCRLGVNFPSGTCTLELTAASTAITNQTSESADYTTTGGVEIVRTFASVATTRLWWKISGIIEVGVTGGTFAIMGKTVNVANTATFHQRSRLSIRILN